MWIIKAVPLYAFINVGETFDLLWSKFIFWGDHSHCFEISYNLDVVFFTSFVGEPRTEIRNLICMIITHKGKNVSDSTPVWVN